MTLDLDKSAWRRVSLGDVATASKEKVDPTDGSVDRYVAGEHMDSDDLKIHRWGEIGNVDLGPAFHRRFRPGQVLYGSRRTYLRKVAVAHFNGVCANTTFVVETTNPDVLLQEFLPFIMTAEPFHAFAIAESKGSVNPYVNWSDIERYEFDLPPLDEQKRLADLLWRVEKHRVSHQHLFGVLKVKRLGYIDNVIKEALANKPTILGEIADVRGGIQKGKKIEGAPVTVPYLRVANVQAGNLDLSEIKTLAVSENDAVRFSLQYGDVLMTEGGDIDKLGRGAVWRDEIQNCLHQNHVFAVRLKDLDLNPYWISLHTESSHGRSYFRIAAKRTSNLASVNKSQVSAFPIGLPDPHSQISALKAVGDLDTAIKKLESEKLALLSLRRSFLACIFGGPQ